MSAVFFEVPIYSLTQAMLARSRSNSPYTLPRSLDGKKVILEYAPTDVPADLLACGLVPLTAAEVKSLYDTDPNWDLSEERPALVATSPTDADGAALSRLKQTEKGWTFQYRSVEFETSNLTILSNTKDDDTSWGDAWIKCYDAQGDEITSQATADLFAVRTEFFFEPTYDMDIIGGELRLLATPIQDVRMWCTAVPDVPSVAGGYKELLSGGLNLRYLNSLTPFSLDGRTSKRMPYDETYHTNKFRMALTHPAGHKTKILISWEHFKA